MSNLSSERMLKLMAYADGELEGDERLEVERSLAMDLDAARFVNDIAGLGELVAFGHGASKTARAIESFDVADSVVAAIGRSEGSNVRSLGAARARRGKGWAVGGVIAAGFALAASLTMMFKQQSDAPMAPMAPVAVNPAASAPSSEPGVDVDPAETAGESVRVFYLSSETSPTTSVVVWVDESRGTGR